MSSYSNTAHNELKKCPPLRRTQKEHPSYSVYAYDNAYVLKKKFIFVKTCVSMRASWLKTGGENARGCPYFHSRKTFGPTWMSRGREREKERGRKREVILCQVYNRPQHKVPRLPASLLPDFSTPRFTTIWWLVSF